MTNTISKQSRTQKPKQSKKRKKARKGWGKKIFLTLFGLFSIATIIGIVVAVFYIFTAPTLTQENLIGTIPSTIYDKNDNEIYKLGGNERVLIDPSSIPKNIEDAILAIEDRRFYEHNGVDFIRIAGSLISNLRQGGLQSGSTITQQLVKLSIFSTSTKDQTIKRKIQEMWLAMGIEREYTKRDILALYLNKVFLANNTYGFGTAAKYYFDKTPEQLTVAQAALFAGMVQAPSTYNPLTNPQAATTRRNIVLQAMLDTQKITQEQFDEVIATPVTQDIVDRSTTLSSTELMLDAYIQMVIDEIKEKTNLDPYTQGLHIYTTLDLNAQKRLTDILDTTKYISWPNKELQAATTIINPNDGSIVAMSGGRHTSILLGINRATMQNRSVGSTSKPLIDYGPSIEYLSYSTGQILLDAPINYTNGPALNNYDRSYRGNVTMRQALVNSLNTTALRAFKAVGADNARAFLAKNGIVTGQLNESNAIGFDASTLQLSAAYSAFANGGYYYKPYTIRKITTLTGEDSQTFTNSGTRSMSDYTAYMITDMLKGVPGYSAPYAAAPNLYQAGKTGTTNYSNEQFETVTNNNGAQFATPDSWYVGYTKDYVIASWIGYDRPYEQGNYVTFSQISFPQLIYKHMITYLSGSSNKDWEKPDSVVRSGTELYIKGSKNTPSTSTTTSSISTTSTSNTNLDDESSTEEADNTTTKKNESIKNTATTTTRTTTKQETTTTQTTTKKTTTANN